MDSESVRTSSTLAVGVIVYSRPAPAVIEGAEVTNLPFLIIKISGAFPLTLPSVVAAACASSTKDWVPSRQHTQE